MLLWKCEIKGSEKWWWNDVDDEDDNGGDGDGGYGIVMLYDFNEYYLLFIPMNKC